MFPYKLYRAFNLSVYSPSPRLLSKVSRSIVSQPPLPCASPMSSGPIILLFKVRFTFTTSQNYSLILPMLVHVVSAWGPASTLVLSSNTLPPAFVVHISCHAASRSHMDLPGYRSVPAITNMSVSLKAFLSIPLVPVY